MSEMVEDSITIYNALQKIKDGKYIMPAFQRQFVWSMGQIEKLWDSILLNYPIATFLFWHIDDTNVSSDTYFCKFLSEVTFNSKKIADSVNYELTTTDIRNTDTAVLDGQQRLTSLYLSLFGEASIRPNYARKYNTWERIPSKLLIELNKNIIVVDEREYNTIKYDIKFSDKFGKKRPTQFELKDILNDSFIDKNIRTKKIIDTIVNVPSDSKDYAHNILQTLCVKIFDEKMIRYTEIIDRKHDDALEMFVRFNSGGKSLRKSDITMSILEAYWGNAKIEFGKILTGSYARFGIDFIIRTALMLYGDVVKSNIDKKIVATLKNGWSDFKTALGNLDDLLKEMKIDIARFSSSWNVLLPIIYFIYYNPDYKNNFPAIKSYLLRAIFFTYFRSGTTGKLQQMKSNINSFDNEITIEMLDQINELRVTDGKIDDIINAEKGSRVAGEVLYYLSIDWLNKAFKYEQDHLHPEARFNNAKPSSISADEWRIWRTNRNKLPNLHLLEGRSNGSKNDMPLIDFYNEMNNEQKESFYRESMIPEDISLEINDFDIFFDERKKILVEKIKQLLN